MARVKVLTHRMMEFAAWAAAAATMLGLAYEGSAAAAHVGSLIQWR